MWCSRAGRPVRRDLPRAAADRRRRAGAGRPAGHDLVSGRRARARCRTTGSRSCCFPVERPELFDAVVTDDDGRVLRDPGEDARRPLAAGSGARSRCRAACCTSSHALWQRARAPRRVHRHAGQRLARARRASRRASAGKAYVDVGTLNGYREAMQLLGEPNRVRRARRGGAAHEREQAHRASRADPRAHRRARAMVPQPRSRRRADRARSFPRRLPALQMAAASPHAIPARSHAARPCSISAATPASIRIEMKRRGAGRVLGIDSDDALSRAGALRRRGARASTSSSAQLSVYDVAQLRRDASTSCCSWACSTTCAIRCWRST